jgi:hypothetical protein
VIADVDPTRIALGIAIGWAVVLVLFVICWKVFKDREHERERMYEGSRMADVLDATDISADEWEFDAEFDAEMDEFEREFWGEKS